MNVVNDSILFSWSCTLTSSSLSCFKKLFLVNKSSESGFNSCKSLILPFALLRYLFSFLLLSAERLELFKLFYSSFG